MNKIAVVTSGMSRGSNLEAMVSYFRENRLPVEVCFVVVTRTQAPVIEKCDAMKIPVVYLRTNDMALFESKLLEKIHQEHPELLVLAGFLKKLSSGFLSSLPCKVVNIHPALLPKYGGEGMYGHFVHEAVFQAGDRMSGATVHWVNENYDAGRIIAQETVDITDCRTPDEIAARVLRVEHQLYGKTIWQILSADTGKRVC
ncbi:MAG TPA: phosphoribosylglycinamide formyltransferase [Candidatus Cloacimonadota bacterium]|nr:phosphoribosylglycinamide formyltransferase [Candidatus Cloacimonadota bacterium]HPT72700.1 phosphoribosylglycinamide formyltransferase [Candidatus Cloacimonadota bacterium]